MIPIIRLIGSRFDTSHWPIVKNDPFDYQAMLGMHVCQECLCPHAHVLTIEHVLAHIVPEPVYAITILFILDLKPS